MISFLFLSVLLTGKNAGLAIGGIIVKPSGILAEIGTITQEKATELIESLPPKKKNKIQKRQ